MKFRLKPDRDAPEWPDLFMGNMCLGYWSVWVGQDTIFVTPRSLPHEELKLMLNGMENLKNDNT